MKKHLHHTERKLAAITLCIIFCTAVLCLCTGCGSDSSSYNGQFDYAVTAAGEVTVTRYTGSGGDVTIPAEIDGAAVTSIGAGAFKDCTTLEKIALPSSIEQMGDGVFEGCTALRAFTMPESATVVTSSMFKGCTSLSTIKLHEGVTGIMAQSFAGCSSLQSITIPESVGVIKEDAFLDCAITVNAPLSSNSYSWYGYNEYPGVVLWNVTA